MDNRLRFIFCTFFTSVILLTVASGVGAETWEGPLSPESTVDAVVKLIDEGHTLSAFGFFKLVFATPATSLESSRERVKVAASIFRSSAWVSLPATDRLDYLRIFLAQGPVTARIQRELIFLAVSVGGDEPVGFLMEYKRNPWTQDYYAGDAMPSLLPPWKILWSAVRRGPVAILKGTGFVSTAELGEVIHSHVCELRLESSHSSRRSGAL